MWLRICAERKSSRFEKVENLSSSEPDMPFRGFGTPKLRV